MIQVVAGSSRLPLLLSVLLCVPGAMMLSLLMLGVEPPLGPLAPLVASPSSGPNVTGTAVALTVIVLLPALALAVSIQRLFAGAQMSPVRLLVAAVPLCILLTFLLALVADQYPCWAGVPNCD